MWFHIRHKQCGPLGPEVACSQFIASEAHTSFCPQGRCQKNSSRDGALGFLFLVSVGSLKTTPSGLKVLYLKSKAASSDDLLASTNAINTVRSAISMTHEKVDGVPLGRHPAVSRLMRGIYNSRPPTPQYTVTWKVGSVTAQLKSWGLNGSLSLKNLSLKLARDIFISSMVFQPLSIA